MDEVLVRGGRTRGFPFSRACVAVLFPLLGVDVILNRGPAFPILPLA